MKPLIYSQRGSSTILIALFMVTLVVFGVLCITTTASELKLAKKNAESQKDFYLLDSEGAKFLSQIKNIMKNVKISAESNNNPKEYLLKTKEELVAKLPNLRSEILEENDELSLIVYKTFALENCGYNKNLSIVLSLREPKTIDEIDSACYIIEWKMWQEPFGYKQSIDLWEGIP